MNYANLQNETLNEVFETTYTKEADFWNQFRKVEVKEVIEQQSSIKITKNKITLSKNEAFILQNEDLFNHLIVTNKDGKSGGSSIYNHHNSFQFKIDLIKNVLKKVCEIRELDGYALALSPHSEFRTEGYFIDHYQYLHEGENKIEDSATIYNFNSSIYQMYNLPIKPYYEATKYEYVIGCYTNEFMQKVLNMGSFIDESLNEIRATYLVSMHYGMTQYHPELISSFKRFESPLKLSPFTMLCYELGTTWLLESEGTNSTIDFQFSLDFKSLLDFLNGDEGTIPLEVNVFEMVNGKHTVVGRIENPTVDSFKDYLLSFESDEDSLALNVIDHSKTLTDFVKSVTEAKFLNSKQYDESKAYSHLSSRYEGSQENLLQILNSENDEFYKLVHLVDKGEKQNYEKLILKITTQDKTSCSVLLIEYDENADTFNYESFTADSAASIYSFLR